MALFKRGDRVESLRWTGSHGTVVRVNRDRSPVSYGVVWDGTRFTETEDLDDELRRSRRPAPGGRR